MFFLLFLFSVKEQNFYSFLCLSVKILLTKKIKIQSHH
ncbi:hypothetical protein LMG8520_2533 [Lactococcus lactis subsp. lactis]|uniref:Uncharacterized protein n=2 Tax=Lactococcus lactis TaxID=1358 RepID=A0A2A5SHG3_LACLH|nr:hypothetical protein LMG8520_2533 [Lactococcus lactis subsp. lactis]PCS12957.1 hypothetical protein RU90_GL002587 [Lactococcus lactis subsp. hordniae]